jgi:hypothetical protein
LLEIQMCRHEIFLLPDTVFPHLVILGITVLAICPILVRCTRYMFLV